MGWGPSVRSPPGRSTSVGLDTWCSPRRRAAATDTPLADTLRRVRGFYTTYTETQHVGIPRVARPATKPRVLLAHRRPAAHRFPYDMASVGRDSARFSRSSRVSSDRACPGSSLYGPTLLPVINVVTRTGVSTGAAPRRAPRIARHRAPRSLRTLFGVPRGADRGAFPAPTRRHAPLPNSTVATPAAGVAAGLDHDESRRSVRLVRGRSLSSGAVRREPDQALPTAAFSTTLLRWPKRTVLALFIERTYDRRSARLVVVTGALLDVLRLKA